MRADDASEFRIRVFVWTLGLTLISMGFYRWFALGDQGFFTIINFLVGLACICIGFLFLAPDVTRFVTAPLQQIIDELYFPPDADAKPPVNYCLGDHRYRQYRYGEALEEYLRILSYHPREFNAYHYALLIVTKKSADEKLARKIFARALRQLENPDEIRTIERWRRYGVEEREDLKEGSSHHRFPGFA